MDTIVKEHKAEHHHEGHAKIRPMAAAKTFKVTVVAKPGTGVDPIDFNSDSTLKNPSNGHLVFNKSNDNMKKSDYYLVEFDLDDHTGLGLQFDPNPMHAFWVAMGDDILPPPCPQAASFSDQIYAISDDPGGRKLTVRNDDDTRQYFAYSLGFIDQNAIAYRYDPIGQNQNGGSGLHD